MPTVAIIQRLTLHTEVMGAIAAIVRAHGYDVSLFYNPGDPWHMVTYFSNVRQPWITQTGDYNQPFQMPADAFDKIVLSTSDEWWSLRRYRQRLMEWMALGRLVVVHHATCYLEQFPQFTRYVGLTPPYGADHWLFPLYSAPAPPVAEAATGIPGLPTLFCVGSLDSKDRADVGRYIAAGGTVTNYVRYPADVLVAEHGDKFRCVSNLSGVDLMAALTHDLANGRGFMWFPIDQTTNYATTKFSGSLALGADVMAVLVMPTVLRTMMQIPEDAVISYTNSVTEPATLEALQKAAADPRPYLDALHTWKCAMWERGQQVLMKQLEG